ncbi:MAG TPA: aspartate/glutamate racemase family protein, partial [Sphingomicrobium sp.]
MKHIGILAHSFEGATLCFHAACLEGVRRLGAHMHPEITMTCSPMALVLDAWERGDNAELCGFFRKDSEKLAAAGADFWVCPDNTAHIALESAGEPFPIPGLHIGEVVAEQALREGRRKVGVLGTKYTMTGPVYPGALGRRGIDWAVPNEGDRELVNR